MSAYGDLDQAIPGLLAEGIQNNSAIKSRSIQDSAGIEFGATVWGYVGNEDKCYNFSLDTAKIVFDADFVTSNSIVITVDGDAWAAVVFDTDHDTTMDALITQGTAEGYEVALDASDSDNRTIYIKKATAGTAVGTVTEAVTGGASQPTGTITYQSDQVFLGIAMYDAKNIATANAGKYLQYEVVNIVQYGVVWATSTGTINALDDVYAVATTGVLTATAGLTINVKAQGNSTTVGTGSDPVTKIEVRGIYKPNAEIAWV